MGSAFALTLVINTFNQPDYLGRVLNAVSRQSCAAGGSPARR